MRSQGWALTQCDWCFQEEIKTQSTQEGGVTKQRHGRKRVICKSTERPQGESKLQKLSLGFQLPELPPKNELLLPGVGHFVTAAGANVYSLIPSSHGCMRSLFNVTHEGFSLQLQLSAPLAVPSPLLCSVALCRLITWSVGLFLCGGRPSTHTGRDI
jgi:hypothetical protein